MPFAKGKSGNPGGKNKVPRAISDLAKAHSRESIERLAFWLASDNAKASVAAAIALLDRAWGKPSQQIDHGAAPGGNVKFVMTIGSDD